MMTSRCVASTIDQCSKAVDISMPNQLDPVLQSVERWLTEVVIRHNFCPFAQSAVHAGRVRMVRSSETQEPQILSLLAVELVQLAQADQFETTLIVLDKGLADFAAYNQFLDAAEAILQELGLEGQLQLASFHPQYCFAGTDNADPANYTNRSPYPLLHILREQSIAWAVDHYVDIDLIPERNIERLRTMPVEQLQQIEALSHSVSTDT